MRACLLYCASEKEESDAYNTQTLIQQYQTDLLKKDTEREALERQLSDVQAQLEESQIESKALAKSLDSSLELVSDSSQWFSVKKQLETDMKALRAENFRLKVKSTEASGAQNEVKALTHDNEVLKHDLETVSKCLDDVTEMWNAGITTLAALKESARSKKAKLKKANLQLLQCKMTITALNNHKQEISAELLSERGKASAIQKENIELNEHINVLQEEKKQLEVKMEQKTHSLKDHDDHVNTVQTLETEKKELFDHVLALQEERRELERAQTEAETERIQHLSDFQKERAELIGHVAALEEERRGLEQELTRSQAQIHRGRAKSILSKSENLEIRTHEQLKTEVTELYHVITELEQSITSGQRLKSSYNTRDHTNTHTQEALLLEQDLQKLIVLKESTETELKVLTQALDSGDLEVHVFTPHVQRISSIYIYIYIYIYQDLFLTLYLLYL